MTDLYRFVCGDLVPFTGEHVNMARFPLRAFPISDKGEIHNAFFEKLREEHPAGNREWKAVFLKPIFSDIMLQQDQMKFLFRTRVIVTALFNLHRKMTIWSFPGMLNNRTEFSVCDEMSSLLVGRLSGEVFIELMNDRQNIRANNGRIKDKRFVDLVERYVERHRLQFTRYRIFHWPATVKPFPVVRWGWLMKPPALPAGEQVLSLEQYHNVCDIPEMPPGQWNFAAIWAKPERNTPVAEW